MAGAFQENAFQEDAFQEGDASQAGFISMLAYWLGGGGATESGEPPEASDVSEWLIRARRRKRR